MNTFIQPNWPAPDNIKACTTLRTGGVSQPPYEQFNLATHVGDDLKQTLENRTQLKQLLKLPNEPIWLKQIHSTIAVSALPKNNGIEADASFTDQANRVCVVLTADCLPILICNRKGTHVAAVHAGWRGLANGVIETTLKALNLPPQELLVWLGPAISSRHYEVGEDVQNTFIGKNPDSVTAFTPATKKDHWFADLYALARLCFKKQGVTAIFGGEHCTYHDMKNFYSYRRDGGKTGRMASLIWITDSREGK